MRLPADSPKVMESACSVPSVKSVRGSNEERAGTSGSISAVTLRSLMKCARNPVGAFARALGDLVSVRELETLDRPGEDPEGKQPGFKRRWDRGVVHGVRGDR